MKKSLVVKLLSVLLMVVLIFTLCSCGNGDADDDIYLSAETELKIKKAIIADRDAQTSPEMKKDPSYVPITVDDIKILHYLGSYNGSVAIMIKGNKIILAILPGFKIAGVLFLFPKEVISIYNDGRVYNLTDAYESGFLTKTDLKKLSDRYLTVYPNLNPEKYDLSGWYILEVN